MDLKTILENKFSIFYLPMETMLAALIVAELALMVKLTERMEPHVEVI